MKVYLVKAKYEVIKLVKECFSDRGRWYQKGYLRLNGRPFINLAFSGRMPHLPKRYWLLEKDSILFQDIRKWHN